MPTKPARIGRALGAVDDGGDWVLGAGRDQTVAGHGATTSSSPATPFRLKCEWSRRPVKPLPYGVERGLEPARRPWRPRSGAQPRGRRRARGGAGRGIGDRADAPTGSPVSGTMSKRRHQCERPPTRRMRARFRRRARSGPGHRVSHVRVLRSRLAGGRPPGARVLRRHHLPCLARSHGHGGATSGLVRI